MTIMERTFMGLDTHKTEPRDRLAIYLRVQYPRDGAKSLATDLNSTVKAAENILGGHWPNSRHWASIAQRFGRDVLEAVFGPDIDKTAARLYAEERELEERLERKRALRRQVEGDRPGAPAGAVAPSAWEVRP